MAEKLELITSLKIDFSQFKNDVEGAKKYLGGLQAEYAKVVQVFGEGSKEAKEAGEAIKQMTEYLKQTGAAGAGIDQPIKSIKSQLKEANAELTIAVQKFGLGSKEAAAAATKVAELKDTIGDAKTLTDAFNPDAKFKGLANAVQGAAGAFAALQGAQALFGKQSEEVQKTLVKVQGALALSQGVNSVLEAADSFKALGNQIKSAEIFQKIFNASTKAAAAIQKAFGVAVNTTSASFKALQGAIVATGIGALVVVLGTVVEKIMAWTDSTEEQEKAQGKLNKQLEKSNDLLDEELKGIDFSTRLKLANAKAAGKSEEELTKIVQDGNADRLKALRDADARAIEISDAALKNDKISAEEKDKLLQKTVETNRAVLNEISRQGVEAAEKNADTAQKAREKEKEDADKRTQNAKEAAEKRKQKAKEAADKEKQLEEERQKDAEQRAQANAARQAAIDKQIQDNRLAQIKEGRYKEQLLVDTQYDQNIQALIDNDAAQRKALKESLDKNLISREEYNKQIKNVEDLSNQQRLAADEAYRIQKAAVDKKYDDQEKLKALNDATAELEKTSEDEAIFFTKRKEALDQEQALLDEAYKNKLISDEEYTKQTKENADTRVRIGKAEIEARKALATNTANLLNTLSELVGKNTKAGKAAAIAGLVIQQAQTVAQVTTDTIASTKAISKKYAGVPGGQIPAAIEIGLNVAQGALAIKKAVGAVKKGIADIKGASASSSPSASGDVQGGGAPIEASAPIPAQQPTTALPQDQINQISSANATVRAYVVESDVSGNQERITRLNRAARIS